MERPLNMTDNTIQVDVPAPSQTKPWGFHGIFDCSSCDLDKIQSADNIKSWLTDLVSKIQATTVSDAIVVTTADGYTAIQITNGSIVAQFVDATQHIYIDIFSNSEFNPSLVEDGIKQFFSAEKINKILLPRNAAL